MKIFQVLQPGIFTTIQDTGRYNYLKYGVPISGAMDTFSLFAANLLVGNKPSDACLEITLIGPELHALAETQIAVTGAALPKINGQTVAMWQTLKVQKDDVISFEKATNGCRAYLAVRGGIDVPLVLGSRATYVRGGFGGLDGRPLKTGDTLESFAVSPLKTGYTMPKELVPTYTSEFALDVVFGPQADMFTNEGISTFLSSQYEITSEADRMGYRLEGPKIEHKGKVDIVSDALLPGAIQVPKSGKPIIILRDAQTTGGYPKIAVLTTPAVSLLGQTKPDNVVTFSEITLGQAKEKLLAYYSIFSSLESLLLKN